MVLLGRLPCPNLARLELRPSHLRLLHLPVSIYLVVRTIHWDLRLESLVHRMLRRNRYLMLSFPLLDLSLIHI